MDKFASHIISPDYWRKIKFGLLLSLVGSSFFDHLDNSEPLNGSTLGDSTVQRLNIYFGVYRDKDMTETTQQILLKRLLQYAASMKRSIHLHKYPLPWIEKGSQAVGGTAYNFCILWTCLRLSETEP